MNLIFVTMDSLNRHFLSAYGQGLARTPNIDAFARRACVFDNHYAGSVPCMPARREMWTGTREMWWRWWGPLEPWDRTIAYQARQAGVADSMLATDHYHFFEWGSGGYQNDFAGFQFIRGHEFDNWRTDPPAELPDWARVMVGRDPDKLIYVTNCQDWRGEADFCSPRTFASAADWLDRQCRSAARGRPFYLHVDSFDPHEPFHVPEPYRSMYTDDDYRRYSPWPRYGRIDEEPTALSGEELAWVRAQYAGKVTMSDAWFGRLIDVVDRHKLWDDTAIILTTDHGHYLGEHGWIGKPRAPLYRTLTHIPLMIWHPGGRCGGRRTGALSQTVDLYATALEALGAPVPEDAFIHSRSLMPVVNGSTARHRDFAFAGYCNAMTMVTDGAWAMTRVHDTRAAEAATYSLSTLTSTFGHGVRKAPGRRLALPDLAAARIPGVEAPVWRTVLASRYHPPGGQYLWDLAADPQQDRNVADAQPGQIDRLTGAIRDHLTELGAPPEQFARLHL